MINPWAIRKFLVQTPRPAFVRIAGGDAGEDTEPLKCSGRSWVKLADTIAAMQPELVQCLDKDQKLLRAMRPELELTQSEGAPTPAGLQDNPDALLLTHLANLVHRAYEHSTQIAFDKMVEVFERMNDRSEGIEARLERTEARMRRAEQDRLDDLHAEAEERAEAAAAAAAEATASGGNAKDAILTSLLGGMFMGGKPPPAAAAAGNGKGS